MPWVAQYFCAGCDAQLSCDQVYFSDGNVCPKCGAIGRFLAVDHVKRSVEIPDWVETPKKSFLDRFREMLTRRGFLVPALPQPASPTLEELRETASRIKDLIAEDRRNP